MDYFLISVSNKNNLQLCQNYGLAGFTNSVNGVWTFSDIQEGDYVSFLYGARVYNLYQVKTKVALEGAESLPPWPPITFKTSGATYYFPFRLNLTPIRVFSESLVRVEFAYVAENLLLRGGYRKTHFQADQTTLQNASKLGELARSGPGELPYNNPRTFTPKFSKSFARPPYIYKLNENILQAVIRRHLKTSENLARFLSQAGIDSIDSSKSDVLGEKALPEGHVDILVNESIPIGKTSNVVIEVKPNNLRLQDVAQVEQYSQVLGSECVSAILIARHFPKKVMLEAKNKGIKTLIYEISNIEQSEPLTFDEIVSRLKLTLVTS